MFKSHSSPFPSKRLFITTHFLYFHISFPYLPLWLPFYFPPTPLSFPFIYLYYFIPNYFTTLSIHAHFVTISLPLCYPFTSPLLRLRLPTHHFITPPLSISSPFTTLLLPFCSPVYYPFVTLPRHFITTSPPLSRPTPLYLSTKTPAQPPRLESRQGRRPLSRRRI